jgi:hypothetical protein
LTNPLTNPGGLPPSVAPSLTNPLTNPGGLPPSVAPSLRRNVSLDDEEDEVDGEVDGDERKQERMERRPERTIDLGTAAAPRSPNAATEDGPGVLIAC